MIYTDRMNATQNFLGALLLSAIAGCTAHQTDRDAVSTQDEAVVAVEPTAQRTTTPDDGSLVMPTQFVSNERPTNPLDATRAYAYLQTISALGPRPSGSAAMQRQQKILEAHFTQLGGKVTRQEFEARHPLTRERVKLANLIVEWHPDRKERVLLCCHYDTRPLPDRDANPKARREGTFVGANDGGSGVAVLMELARLMPELDSKYGVDFVLFDGEELVYVEPRDKYFLGSEHFATDYANNPPEHKYVWGVLLDMVGDADLQIYLEANSYRWRESRPMLQGIWSTAARLGVREFVPRVRHEVNDDHLQLRNIAKIPSCDIIDFDYPYWHTENDIARHCSGASLAKVGWVVYEWLRTAE